MRQTCLAGLNGLAQIGCGIGEPVGLFAGQTLGGQQGFVQGLPLLGGGVLTPGWKLALDQLLVRVFQVYGWHLRCSCSRGTQEAGGEGGRGGK
ncbi:hypothetical protein D3C76_1048330 [compost metagenome]